MRFKTKLVTAAMIVAVIIATTVAVTAPAEDEKPEEMKAKNTTLAQKEIPAAVLTAFHKAYPKAKITGTDADADSTGTLYEIESADGGAKRTTVYTADGALIEVEDVIAMKDLPSEAQAEITKAYPDGEIKTIERATRGDAVTFEATIESGEMRAEMVFDKAGKLIWSDKKAEDEGEEEDD